MIKFPHSRSWSRFLVFSIFRRTRFKKRRNWC